MLRFFLPALVLPAVMLFSTGAFAQATKPAGQKAEADKPMKPVVEREGLPRVLLIGDSISIGYTVPVRRMLADEANVIRPLTNCGPTTRGVQHLDEWLGEGKWDVIHFNWGLHDLKYIGTRGDAIVAVDSEGSHQQVAPEAYAAHLERLVKRLKETGATLIWCATTPVPEGAKGRIVGDSQKYNAIAAEIMQRHGIATNDLYAATMEKQDEIQLPANVHFKPAGSEYLAEQVVKKIRAALAAR